MIHRFYFDEKYLCEREIDRLPVVGELVVIETGRYIVFDFAHVTNSTGNGCLINLVKEPDIWKAKIFAQAKHLGQVRDSGQDFYLAHCLVVYNLVKSRRGDAETLCAALLHDTLEDTDTTYEELERDFGKNVADMVLMLTHTDDNVFPLLKFKNDVYEEIIHKAMVVKFADTFANTSEMYTWSPEQRVVYLNKKRCWRTEKMERGVYSRVYMDDELVWQENIMKKIKES